MRAPLWLSLSLFALGSIGCGSFANEGSEPGDPIAAGGAGPAAGSAPSESPPPEPEAVNGIAPCPPLESGYQSDERCILPPEPGTGTHIHIGPNPSELLYNSVTDNGTPDRASLRPGGHSGLLVLRPGDRIEWECEVINQQAVTLYFGNEVYTAEM